MRTCSYGYAGGASDWTALQLIPAPPLGVIASRVLRACEHVGMNVKCTLYCPHDVPCRAAVGSAWGCWAPWTPRACPPRAALRPTWWTRSLRRPGDRSREGRRRRRRGRKAEGGTRWRLRWCRTTWWVWVSWCRTAWWMWGTGCARRSTCSRCSACIQRCRTSYLMQAVDCCRLVYAVLCRAPYAGAHHGDHQPAAGVPPRVVRAAVPAAALQRLGRGSRGAPRCGRGRGTVLAGAAGHSAAGQAVLVHQVSAVGGDWVHAGPGGARCGATSRSPCSIYGIGTSICLYPKPSNGH